MYELNTGPRHQYIGWALVLFALASAYYNGWLVSLERGVWFDEALTAFFVEQSWDGLFKLISEFEANMSFYYISLKLWAGLFPSEIGLRFFSFLAYLGTGAIFVLAIRRIVGLWTGIVFLALFLGHFFLIRYGVEVRGYAFAGLFLAGLWYCLLRAATDGGGRWWVAYALIGLFAVHSHFFVSLGIFGMGIIALLLRTPAFSIRYWFFSHAAIALSFVPILLFVVFKESGQLAWQEPPDLRALLDTAFMYAGAAPPAPDWVRRSLLLFFAVLCGVGLLAGTRFYASDFRRMSTELTLAKASLIAVAALPVILAFVMSQVEPAFSWRFFIPFVPFFLVLVALGIGSLGRTRSLLVFTVLLGLMTTSAVSYSDRSDFSWSAQVGNMFDDCNGAEGVLFMTPNAQSVFRFYETRSREADSCNWTIYPYQMTPDNYTSSPEIYPEELTGLRDLEALWIYESHLGEDEAGIYQSYMNEIETEFRACSLVIRNEGLTLLRCVRS
ncbi:hypothetical protein [Marinobacter flavimaris]|uniref:glycosyltransferase family 39 protein n=1 Tax=Marinobacter flavimaris TaxID=262076 RepID=UPI003868FEAA